jgi:PAS domain S-box-containing protein
VEQAGVWADCVRQRQPVIHNDYASLENRKGLPAGHAPLNRELTVPILRSDQVVAIFGIGNKPQDYTVDDVELVSTLVDFAWDIIERRRVEDALRKSEQKFRTLVDWTYDCEQWVDPQGKIVYISPSCERITGYKPEDFISDLGLLARIVHPDDLNFYRKHHQLVHDETADISSVEYRIIAKDGSEHWLEHNCRPLFGEDNRYLGRRVSNRDITGRKLAEKEIRERDQKENMLTHTIHSMQLEIARDLHDTVGQNIGYLRMKLDHLSETGFPVQEDLKKEITNMLKVANESYDLIRGTLSVLQSGGLADPLALFIQYANQVEERSHFKINVSSQGEPRPLSPNQVRQLFYVFREALSNIEKHARAGQVSVALTWESANLNMMIADDGHGFRLDDTQVRHHYGLKFMKERIELVNGSFSVLSKDGSGTKIKITLPYEK